MEAAAGANAANAAAAALAAAGAAATAARRSYGRLVALLAWRWRDIAAAEDALGDAFAAALRHWPVQGIPQSPEAWLMRAAQRQLLQRARHDRMAADPAVQLLLRQEDDAPPLPDIPDRRLALLFACAHPALPADVHAPLMLQVVLGLEVRTIASAFLVAPATLAQRLVRAKARMRQAGIAFEEPEARELPARLAAVLEGIYGAYTLGSDTAAPAAQQRSDLADEALYLARLVATLQPDSGEAHGLRALLLYCQARRPALFGAGGDGPFVPLAGQDTALWNRTLLAEAEQSLWQAARLRQPGAFQFEAAIQSAHCQRAFTGQTPWRQIEQLYATLLQHFPSAGARIGHALALAHAQDAGAGLAALHAIDAASVATYQPYWVALAHLLRQAGPASAADAAAALQRAIGLTEDERVRRHLQLQGAAPGVGG